MAGGLFALLDDVAVLAKMAAASVDDVAAAAGKASAKAAGVIVDDAAVTPRYVDGLESNRELSIIGRIAKGSIRNKLVFILPALLLLSQFLPMLLTPLLMLGGTYLCFEGVEKLWHAIKPSHEAEVQTASQKGPEAEDQIVSSATRTDFILSAEIMVIALNEVANEPLLSRAIILALVALLITALVYGVVALIVRMDDFGLKLAGRSSRLSQRTGLLLVKAMPKVMGALSVIGVAAMLWVGGHILLVGFDDLGWHTLYGAVHELEHQVEHLMPFGDEAFSWLANTVASALLGLAIGTVVVLVINSFHRIKGSEAH